MPEHPRTCSNGHPLTGNNTYHYSGRQYCRACQTRPKPRKVEDEATDEALGEGKH